MSYVMNRALPAALAALTLIASTQLSFAQPGPPGNDGDWQQPGRKPGPPHPPPPPPHQAAAKFVFRRGSASVTCPQNVSLQDCVRAATELANNLSRIHARERGNPPSTDRGNSDGGNSDGGNSGE